MRRSRGLLSALALAGWSAAAATGQPHAPVDQTRARTVVSFDGVTGSSAPPAIFESVARQGEPVPGMDGFTFGYIYLACIDAAGNVLFPAWLTGPAAEPANDMALFFGPPGGIQKVIQEGDPAPDLDPGVVIADLYFAGENVSETGWIVFVADLSGPGIVPGFNDQALFAGPPGDLRMVLQAGAPGPGCAPDEYILPDWFGSVITDNGTLGVGADLETGGYWTDRAMWIGPRDDLQLVYRDGMPAPGCPEGVYFTSADCVADNDLGQIAFRGLLAGPGVTADNRMGRWMGGPGTLEMLTRDGEPVPGMEPGVVWKTAAPGLSHINGLGDLADRWRLQGPGVTEDNDDVLVLWPADDEPLYWKREGDPAPEAGVGVEYDGFSYSWINNCREVVYYTRYRGDGISDANKWGAYFGPPGEERLILREGGPAPTLSPGVTVRYSGAAAGSVAMSDVGGFVTCTELDGAGVTDENCVILWFWHRVLGRIMPLLRSGDTLDGATVFAEDRYDFAGSGYRHGTGGADGFVQPFNDRDMTAMCVEFTDGTRNLYRISRPVFGDGDADGDLDAEDWLLISGCGGGPDGESPPECAAFDLDVDADVDLHDLAMFQALYALP